MTLHLFTDDDGNIYAAETLEHAKELWTKDTGQHSDESGEWVTIPDERSLTIDDDGVKSTKTAAEWVAEVHGPGCCFSTNY